MYHNGVFLIKRSANEILVEAYKQCVVDKPNLDQIRCYNFHNKKFGEGYSEDEFNKCVAYLANVDAIKFVSPGIIALTGKGVEIAEKILINSPPSPVKPKEPEPYKPSSVRIVGSDLIKAGGNKRNFKAVFTDENCNPIEMSPLWSFECNPLLKDHVSYSVSEDNTTCEISASDVNELIGTQVKLTVSDKNGTRQDEKLIDIVGLFD